jgi:excinuclease ABC subunit C
MFEVLSRRFARGRGAAEGSEADAWELPDLFVVDGGRGQLAVALTAAHDLGLHDLAIVGLAKERENALGEELVDRVYLPNQKNPIALRPNSPELFLLAVARDEAHRFSNRGRKKVGKPVRGLDVPGIGPKTRWRCSPSSACRCDPESARTAFILAVKGVKRAQLEALRKHLGREGDTDDDGVVEDETPEDPVPVPVPVPVPEFEDRH